MSADVLIVGGGLTGATLALALAREDFEVVLADAAEAPVLDEGPEPGLRVSTLTPASVTLLGRLGIDIDDPRCRAQAFDTMRVWEEDTAAELVFQAGDDGLDRLGHVVENRRIQALLWRALARQPSVTLVDGDPLEHAAADQRGARVGLASGERLRARLLVAADGAGSPTRAALDIPVERFDYEQQGLVTRVRAAHGHGDTAWQRFLPEGPLALLPMPEGHASIVWSQPPAQAERRLALDDDELGEALTRASQSRLGALSVAGSRARFPLVRQRARRYVGPGVALLGDAAHVIHPLAGQGANLGLLDAAALAEVLAAARDAGRDFASEGVLRGYERWRRTDNELVAEAMSAIRAVYAMDAPPFPGLRRLGTRLVNQSALARRRFIRHASGYGGRVPALCRRVPETVG